MFRPLAAFASSSVHQFTHSRADYITHGGQVIKSRWGDELTADKMKECIWLRPEAVAQIEFLEWTAREIGLGIRNLLD